MLLRDKKNNEFWKKYMTFPFLLDYAEILESSEHAIIFHRTQKLS